MDSEQAKFIKDWRLKIHDTVLQYASTVDGIENRLDEGADGMPILTKQDRMRLDDIAVDLMPVAFEVSEGLGLFIEGESLRDDEKKRLIEARDWLRLSVTSLGTVRADVQYLNMGGGEHASTMTPALRKLVQALGAEIDHELDEDTLVMRELHDGDVFDKVAGGIRGLRRAWDQMAAAMIHVPGRMVANAHWPACAKM